MRTHWVLFRRRELLVLLLVCCCASAQAVDVYAHTDVTHQKGRSGHTDSSGVVLWLTPLDKSAVDAAPRATASYTLAQKNKQFIPHVLVVPVGSSVDFPNLDPFFHNVFSLFNGKRFDLGLYEGHSHRAVRFDREGVSFIFCNIHPDMGAVVVSLSTPYYGVSASDGTLRLIDVPQGRYRMNVWAENVALDRLNDLSKIVTIDPQRNQLGTIRLELSGDVMNQHQNKFGEGYNPPPTQPYE